MNIDELKIAELAALPGFARDSRQAFRLSCASSAMVRAFFDFSDCSPERKWRFGQAFCPNINVTRPDLLTRL